MLEEVLPWQGAESDNPTLIEEAENLDQEVIIQSRVLLARRQVPKKCLYCILDKITTKRPQYQTRRQLDAQADGRSTKIVRVFKG